MIEAKKSISEAHTDKDRTFHERYCDSPDQQVMVFDLYGLKEKNCVNE
jgi:hypothetical protein